MTKLINLTACAIVSFVCQRPVEAVNPFVTDNYSADPSAHVFNGRLYVYGSHDRTDASEYDMNDYHVYSTDDMQNWKDEGVAISLKDVPWAEGHFWAPDCNEKNGIYYFYFPTRVPKDGPLKGRPVGVATSHNPSGPFTEAQPIPETENYSGIDPAVFLDDDGTAYFILAAHPALRHLQRRWPVKTAAARSSCISINRVVLWLAASRSSQPADGRNGQRSNARSQMPTVYTIFTSPSPEAATIR